jgi:hypothetical protein
LPERVGAAASLLLDERQGELVSLVLRGVKAKSIPISAARLLLERALPPTRAIKLDLPVIRTAADLNLAEEIIMQAMNDGILTPAEAAAVQSVVAEAWRARREAATHEQPRSPEEVRAAVEAAARGYGMGYASEKD